MDSSFFSQQSTSRVPGAQGASVKVFERCAKRYAVDAQAYARGLQTALYMQTFKQG